MSDQQIRHDRVKSLEVMMQYPIGFVTIWHESIAPDHQKPKRGIIRLALTADEAHKIGEQFLRLAQSIEAAGGSKQ